MKEKIKFISIVVAIVSAISLAIAFLSKDKELMENHESERFQNIIDSLDTVNEELRRIIADKQKEEEEAFERFKKETEKMKIEYEKEIDNIRNLNADSSIEFLSRELSSED